MPTTSISRGKFAADAIVSLLRAKKGFIMKRNVTQMSTQEIKRELNNFEWEYIALSDRVQTDEAYADGAAALDQRKTELSAELEKRANTA